MDATPPPIPQHASEEAAPPKKKRSALKITLIVLGVLVGGILLLLGIGLLFLWLEKELPVEESDRQVVVTAALLGAWIEDFEVEPDAESIRKVKNIDGSYELRYEYDGPSLSIYCFVGMEKSLTDAKTVYAIERKAEEISLGLMDLDLGERNDLLRFGDDSKAGVLTYEGELNGNFFSCRAGTRIYTVWWSGVGFEDSTSFRELIEPVLRRWRSWTP